MDNQIVRIKTEREFEAPSSVEYDEEEEDSSSSASYNELPGTSLSSLSAQGTSGSLLQQQLPPLPLPRGGGSSSTSSSRSFMPKKRTRWTPEEDALLKQMTAIYGENFNLIAKHFPQRSEMQCSTRWFKVLSPNLIKGQWTEEEDRKVVELVQKYGAKKWTFIAKQLNGRIGKQCRER